MEGSSRPPQSVQQAAVDLDQVKVPAPVLSGKLENSPLQASPENPKSTAETLPFVSADEQAANEPVPGLTLMDGKQRVEPQNSKLSPASLATLNLQVTCAEHPGKAGHMPLEVSPAVPWRIWAALIGCSLLLLLLNAALPSLLIKCTLKTVRSKNDGKIEQQSLMRLFFTPVWLVCVRGVSCFWVILGACIVFFGLKSSFLPTWLVYSLAVGTVAWHLIKLHTVRRLFEQCFPRLTKGRFDNAPPTLLKSQHQAKEAIMSLLKSNERWMHEPQGMLIGLQARWGAGKSLIVRQLKQELDPCVKECLDQEFCVIEVNVWKQQTEHDLHTTIFLSLLSHPCVFGRFAARLPFRLALALWMQEMKRFWPLHVVSWSGFQLQMAAKPVSLPWQLEMEGIIDQLHTDGTRVVFILDEVERAAPAMAGAALTLARRALSQTSAAVIIPYVKEQIRLKVFHPYVVQGEDLASTVFALMAEKLNAWNIPIMSEAPAARMMPETRAADEAQRNSSDQEAGRNSSAPGCHAEGRYGMWQEHLLSAWMKLDQPKREVILRAAEEKYLRQSIQILPPQPEEYAALMVSQLKVVPAGRLQEDRIALVQRMLADCIWKLREGKEARMGPSIRTWVGRLAEMIPTMPQSSTNNIIVAVAMSAFLMDDEKAVEKVQKN